MYIQNGEILWTDDDKNNLSIKKYSDEEVKKIISIHKKQRVKMRLFMFILLAASIINGNIFSIFYIATIFIIIFWLAFEQIWRNENSYIKSKYYIKFEIKEKLELEKTYDISHDDENISTYYPIIAIDTTTYYETKIYVDEDIYNKNIGEIVAIKVVPSEFR